MRKKTVRDSCHATAVDILEVWAKAHIPTRLKKHIVDKRCLCHKIDLKSRRNVENEKKKTEQIDEKAVLISSSSSSDAEQETEEEDDEPSTSAQCSNTSKVRPTLVKKTRVNLFERKISRSFDVAKISNRGAAVVLTPMLQHLGSLLTSGHDGWGLGKKRGWWGRGSVVGFIGRAEGLGVGRRGWWNEGDDGLEVWGLGTKQKGVKLLFFRHKLNEFTGKNSKKCHTVRGLFLFEALRLAHPELRPTVDGTTESGVQFYNYNRVQ
ncbi:hypothetical protein Btru_077171 [Bulinus truncatus]|nr:hypothetical protein Btru_077171 [Bulinus truncatus]